MDGLGNKEIMAKNIRFYLEKTGRSQKELSEMLGVSTSTFNDWVTAKNYPRIGKIEKMAKIFGILKSDLIEDKQKQLANNELSLKKQRFIKLVEGMTDSQLEKLEKILSLVESIDQ